MIIPDARSFDPILGALMHTGERALDAVRDCPPGLIVAADIETPGLDDPFTIKCVTFAWRDPRDGQLHSVLLDPARRVLDAKATREMHDKAQTLVFHNSSFDVPGLVLADLLALEDIPKIQDTIIYARMAFPDTLEKKGLEALTSRMLGIHQFEGGLAAAIKAFGYRSKQAWFREADINLPTYRVGAMADTICTLRLLPELFDATVKHLLDHPFSERGLTDEAACHEVMAREQRVNHVMLRRNAVGINVDREYLDRYSEKVEGEVLRAEHVLRQVGVDPGSGAQMVEYLNQAGELPDNWPRTKTGKLSFAKDNLAGLEHPLADAYREVAHATKILGYLNSVAARSRVTGRLHGQTNILGASTTGRMSYVEPALQQFPEEARPILVDDGQGFTSIDWSQIEPVTMANMAGDLEFLAPFEAGADLYEPIQRAAGIDRKTAKVVLLATMYGQGDGGLASSINKTLDAALQIKRQMFAAMPESAKFMGRISAIAGQYGMVPTADGRILTVPMFKGEYAAYKAVNYLCQGTAYSILSDSIDRCRAAGLADHIQLALHDELVVDSAVAEDVREIMMKPPEFMTRWCGREPIFRTDLADMGHAWASV